MISIDTVRKIALSFPFSQESISYGTPSFKVQGKMFARILEDNKTISVNISHDDRHIWLQKKPDTFSVNPHFEQYTYMIVSLEKVKEEDLKLLLKNAWKRRAPKGLLTLLKS